MHGDKEGQVARPSGGRLAPNMTLAKTVVLLMPLTSGCLGPAARDAAGEAAGREGRASEGGKKTGAGELEAVLHDTSVTSESSRMVTQHGALVRICLRHCPLRCIDADEDMGFACQRVNLEVLLLKLRVSVMRNEQ